MAIRITCINKQRAITKTRIMRSATWAGLRMKAEKPTSRHVCKSTNGSRTEWRLRVGPGYASVLS